MVHSVGVGVLRPQATAVATNVAAPRIGRSVRIGTLQSRQHTIGRMTWIAVTIGGAQGSVAAHYGVNHLVHVRGRQIDGFIAVWIEYQFGARST